MYAGVAVSDWDGAARFVVDRICSDCRPHAPPAVGW